MKAASENAIAAIFKVSTHCCKALNAVGLVGRVLQPLHCSAFSIFSKEQFHTFAYAEPSYQHRWLERWGVTWEHIVLSVLRLTERRWKGQGCASYISEHDAAMTSYVHQHKLLFVKPDNCYAGCVERYQPRYLLEKCYSILRSLLCTLMSCDALCHCLLMNIDWLVLWGLQVCNVGWPILCSHLKMWQTLYLKAVFLFGKQITCGEIVSAWVVSRVQCDLLFAFLFLLWIKTRPGSYLFFAQ